jgi:16S rRNA (adenine1518-N6/adenine1519-N6)-dimethyltransferase
LVERGRPKKRLGQHFLKDPNTARIVAGDVGGGDMVLEVGPGKGALTTVLAERAGLVHVVEVDEGVLPELESAVGEYDNVCVHIGDALSLDYGDLEPPPGKLAANLPYNSASPLVLKLLEEAEFLRSFRFMVQLEVARRMSACPGEKDYGAYGVLVQLLGRVRIVHRVSPRVFDPPPRVESAVVEIERAEPPAEYAGVKEVVLAAFSKRRKRLANNLPGEWRSLAPSVLESLGYGTDARAEELAPGEFVALYRGLRG